MKKQLIPIICIGGGFLLLFTVWWYKTYPPVTKVTINNHAWIVKVAITSEEKEIGLSRTTSLAPNTGMIFPFLTKELHQFWMKNMNFPLDFIWMDERTVVEVTPNVQPCSTGTPCEPFRPTKPSTKVLEIPAGEAQKYDIKAGDVVIIK